MVGSSILIIYDDVRVGAWLIDFAKTRPVPNGLTVNHRSVWNPGNHEEGFLYGLDQLILASVYEFCSTSIVYSKNILLLNIVKGCK